MNEINNLLGRIDERTRSIDEKLDTHVAEFNRHRTDDKAEFKEIKDRQRGLEIKMGFYAGTIVVVIFIIKAVFKI